MGKIFLIKARLENENEKLAQNIADCPFRLRNRLYKRFSRRRRRRAGRRRFSRALSPAAEKRPRYRASRNSSDKLNQRAGLSAKRQR